MSLLLRKIKRNRWNLATTELNQPLPADPLADLATTGNVLSFWEIADDRSNLSLVITGLAASVEHVSHLDVVILDTQLLGNSIPPFKMTEGKTPYSPAIPYHRDMEHLTADDLVCLADAIREHVDFFEQFSLKEVEKLLAEAVQRDYLNLDNKPHIQNHLRERNLI